MFGRRADEGDLVRFQNFGETRVFRQEAVARMHGVGAGDLAGRKQLRNVQIAVACGRRADAHAFVGEAHMHRVGISGRMHRHRLDAQFFARPQHTQRDLATVGNQDL